MDWRTDRLILNVEKLVLNMTVSNNIYRYIIFINLINRSQYYILLT